MNIKSAWLTTTRSCNCRCNWCYAKETLGWKSFMDFDKAILAVDELKRKGVSKIVLIGGGPTIYNRFLDLIKYIHKSGINCTIATNGIKFKDINFAKATVEAGANNINISLKATTEEEYKALTGNGALKDVLLGYRNLQSIGFNPIFSYVIVNNNYHNFENLINLLERNNVTKVGFQFVKPVLELYKYDEIMNLKDMAKFTEYIYQRMKNSRVQYSVEVSFPLCLIDNNVLNKLISERKITTCCHVQKGSGIVFDTDFKVLPCNHFAEYPFSAKPIDFSDGEAIEKLWQSEEVKSFRDKARCYPSKVCKTCEYWNICGGGCFTRWLFINPNDYINK